MKLVISSLIEWILGHFPAHKLHREEGDGHVLPHHKVKLDLRYCMSDTRLVWLSQAARQGHLMKICGLTEDEPKACFFSC